MTFHHVAKTIDYHHGFECMIKGQLSNTAKVTLKYNSKNPTPEVNYPDFPTSIISPYDDYGKVIVTYQYLDDDLKQFTFIHHKHYFEVTFAAEYDAQNMGFIGRGTKLKAEFEHETKQYIIRSIPCKEPPDVKEFTFTSNFDITIYTDDFEAPKEMYVDEAIQCNSTGELVTVLQQKFKKIFKCIDVQEGTHKISMTTHDYVTAVKFLNSLNLVLGYERINYETVDNKRLLADYSPSF